MSRRSTRKFRGKFRRAGYLAGLMAVMTGLLLGGVLTAPGQAAPRPVKPATSTDQHWAGYKQTGNPGTYRSASASWTVPALTSTGSTTSITSQWVGIDGQGKNGLLIQAGTREKWDGATKSWDFWAWSEIYPTENEIDKFRVDTGDNIFVQIEQQASTTWWIYVLDLTKGETISRVVNYTGPMDSAEFIAEDPPVDGVTQQMATMTPVTFRNARINGDGAKLTAGQRVFQVQGTSQTATPSLPNAEGNGFTVDDGAFAPGSPQTPVFQRHRDGSVWAFTGSICTSRGCPGWTLIDNYPAAVAISAGAGTVYELHSDGSVWEWIGGACTSASVCPGWIELDNNPGTASITAGNGTVYELRRDGSLWKATGEICQGTTPCPGVLKLDDNAVSAITAGAGTVFELRKDGSVWQFTGVPCAGIAGCPGWVELDNNPGVAIEAGAGTVFELRRDGKIYQWFPGQACNGANCYDLQALDDNPATVGIAAGGAGLYQLRRDGTVWVSTGKPCTPFLLSCPGWAPLPGSSPVIALAASTTTVFRLDNNGTFWELSSGINGTRWYMIDNYGLIAQITVPNGT
jgi:hypothetical protein